MSGKSSFLPRLSLSRNDGPGLPFHNPKRSPPIRKKTSEYDLSELSPRPSPRPEDELLSPETWRNRKASSERRSSSPSTSALSSRTSNAGSFSKTKPPSRILFNGPPPPIAASRMIYRDEEEVEPSRLDASTIARGIGSMFLDRSSPSSSSHRRTTSAPRDHEPDSVWRTLQRRERTLQKELQRLLDAQSVGLAGNLGDAVQPGPTSAGTSEAGSSTPTGTHYTDASTSMTSSKHVAFAQTSISPSTGQVIPVRQPKYRPISLSEARAGLARYITLLADLKAEEDATLAAALSARKQALAQLRKLSSQQEGIVEELHGLEEDKEEPLARELRELSDERKQVAEEIAELEERLVGLRNRKRWLDAKVDDVRNRREAGLSGYKGALKEVEGKLGTILRRPGVRPLDLEVIGGVGEDGRGDPGGAEFLRLKPERRTPDMARDWWEGEVALLERRKVEVDRDRKALEEGVEVWKAAVGIVDEYERGLVQALDSEGTGAERKTPEEAVHGQLLKVREVSAALEEKYRVAEVKGWNLLICAIGAELGAYKLADELLSKTLEDMGVDLGDERDKEEEGAETPHLGRSMSMRDSGARLDASVAFTSDAQSSGHRVSGGGHADLVDLHNEEEDRGDTTAEESDNEVPPDLLVSAANPALGRESSLSEDELVREFLAEHRSGSFGSQE
ncbi:hypothetical protein QBC42DRAFT_263578 [Cladorrhinum samala]|uniref:Autophagy-related protein 28 n=1 Tax=Cladorrhinum samala TaxID=585594 RepID=A0AAV9HWF8_9PEZI|nr:hypothetical protein QBC42DRAFT_263578 [Cladorrhinum samala]